MRRDFLGDKSQSSLSPELRVKSAFITVRFETASHTKAMYETNSLKNHFLLPMPQMRDPKFAKSLIYLVGRTRQHGAGGQSPEWA